MPPLILSVFSTFATGGPQVRFAAMANHFGTRYRHAVIAMDGNLACRERLDPSLDVLFPTAPIVKGDTRGNIPRIRRFLREMQPHVVVTNNWGTIEWAIAQAVLPIVREVHIEDGFGPEERERQLPRRAMMRRLVLRRATVVLPSRTLMAIARDVWKLPERQLVYLPNGIDLSRFVPRAVAEAVPVIGTVATLRAEKNIGRMLRAVAAIDGARLLIVGDGPERAGLEAETARLGLSARVRFVGHKADARQELAAMSVFALSSDTEQMPLSVIEAMACGLPIAATDVGDVRAMLSEANTPYVVARDDAALAGAIAALLGDARARASIGRANRARAEAAFDDRVMFAAYAALFDG